MGMDTRVHCRNRSFILVSVQSDNYIGPTAFVFIDEVALIIVEAVLEESVVTLS